MPNHCLSGLRAAGNDVQHAGRNASFDRQLTEPQRGQRGLLGGLQNNRAAAGQRRTELPGGEQQREIPRNDQPHHPHRLAQRISERRLKRVDGLAVDLGCPSGVVAQNIDHHGHIHVARFEDRLAVVQRLQFGEFVDMVFDQVGQPPDQAAPFAGRHLAPGSAPIFESFAGGPHGVVHVLRTGFNDLGQHFARGRIDGIKLLPAVNPLTSNQQSTWRNSYLGGLDHVLFPSTGILPAVGAGVSPAPLPMPYPRPIISR